MMERFFRENFYLLLYGPNLGAEARCGEIDLLDMRDGTISWGSTVTAGLSSPPEWTEILVPCPTTTPVQQALMLAAGCAAEQLLDPSLAQIAQQQSVGDRGRFLDLCSSESWEQSVEQSKMLLTNDRSALDKIAEAVGGSLQTVRQIPSGRLPGGLLQQPQFREAALFSYEVKALAEWARQPGGGIEHGYSFLRRVRAMHTLERMGQSER